MIRLFRRAFVLSSILALALALRLSSALAAEPVELTVYHSPLCASCQEFEQRLLPDRQANYGEALVVRHVDISTPEGLAELELAEAAAGSFNNPLPVLQLDDILLADVDQSVLAAQLDSELLARLGPPNPLTATDSHPATVEPTSAVICSSESACVTGAPLHVAVVSKPYCDVCDRTRLLLGVVAQDYPRIVIHEFDQAEDAEILEAIGHDLGLPTDQRLIAPSLYVGSHALVGEQVNSEALRAVLDEYVASGAPAFWEQMDTSAAQGSILARFRSLSALGVLLAGLIDGVNPCAFATILFFVSYLAVSRRERREMVLVGLAFALGVFVTYFAVGLGAMRLLSVVQAVRGVGVVLYSLMALACLVLGVLSYRDYLLARQGNLGDMSLNLPAGIRERIHRQIRAGRKSFWGAALLSGIVVSLLELACTGQVYLPTISYVLSMPEMRASALLHLALYNLAFIFPLLVVLALAVYGVSVKRFQDLFVRHAAKTKLAMAGLFVLLGVLLAIQVLMI